MNTVLTDSVLREAAIQVRDAMLASLPNDDEIQIDITPSFERKMAPLLAKMRRRYHFQQISKRVAAVLIAALIGVTTWLAVDEDARAVALKWLRTVYEDKIVYQFFGGREVSADIKLNYEPQWLPDGYKEVERIDNPSIRLIEYDYNGTSLYFKCFKAREGAESIFITEGYDYQEKEVEIGTLTGIFYEVSDLEESNELMWIDEDMRVAFIISAFLDEETMVQIAESVQMEPEKIDIDYEPQWLPDGYEEIKTEEGYSIKLIVYDYDGIPLYFTCFKAREGAKSVFLTDENYEMRQTMVGSITGDFIEYFDPDETNELIWIDEDAHVVFTISAFLDEETMVRIAESVTKCSD